MDSSQEFSPQQSFRILIVLYYMTFSQQTWVYKMFISILVEHFKSEHLYLHNNCASPFVDGAPVI